MPTKSNNKGGRGGKRPGAGRPKKSKPIDLEIVRPQSPTNSNGYEFEGKEIPKPSEFLASKQVEAVEPLQAVDVYNQTWNWLQSVGCTGIVSKQLVERYSLTVARWIQCEEMISKFGFLGQHPTTGAAIPSQYVNISIQYLNQANRLWNEIFQIAKDSGDSLGDKGEDAMDNLLRMRKGG